LKDKKNDQECTLVLSMVWLDTFESVTYLIHL